MGICFNQHYSVDENGYPTDLPRIEDYIYPPYYMPCLEQMGITVRCNDDSYDKAHKWAIEFYLLLNSHFAFFHNHTTDNEEEIISSAVDECIELFKAYIKAIYYYRERLSENNKVIPFSHLFSQVKLWIEDTKSVVWSAFRNNRVSSDPLNKKRGTARLLRELLCTLDELYSSFVEDPSESPYQIIDNYIFYNLWGDQYAHLKVEITQKDILTTDEKAIIDIQENKRACYSAIESRIKEATECEEEAIFHQKVESLCLLIEQMFIDYMRFYKKEKNLDSGLLRIICTHWQYETEAIIFRAYANLSAEYAVELTKGHHSCIKPCTDGEEMYAHEKCWFIADKAKSTVSHICSDFVSNVLPLPWLTRLNALDINYDSLYIAIKEKCLPWTSLSDFKYAITYADFDRIMVGAKERGSKSGAIGGIRFLISELGDKIGKDWLIKAAESITSKKGGKAIAEIRLCTATQN